MQLCDQQISIDMYKVTHICCVFLFFKVLLLAMKDMNVAKLTASDLPLFNGITSDLFPGVDVPVLDYSIVR